VGVGVLEGFVAFQQVYDLFVVDLDERGPYSKVGCGGPAFDLGEDVGDDPGEDAFLVGADVGDVGAHGVALAAFFKL